MPWFRPVFQELAAQIKRYQVEVNEVSEKNRELALDSAHLSPKLFRKHYLPGSAYDDYFSAAQIQHRVGSPLPASSPLFYDTLPTFELSAPRASSSVTSGSRDVLDLPLDSSPARRESPLPDSPGASLDLPRKIPPPKKDTIPRPTWSDGAPNKTTPGKPVPSQSPGVSQDKNGFFRQSEMLENPVGSVSTSGHATAPPSVRSVRSGPPPVTTSSHTAQPSPSAPAQSGPTLSLKTHGADSEIRPMEAITRHRLLEADSIPATEAVVQQRYPRAATLPQGRSETLSTGAQAGTPGSSKTDGQTAGSPPWHTLSLDSGLDTGANASLTSVPQATAVSSVVERLAAAMAASAPTRPPPPGARPTELLRMGASSENLSSPRAFTAGSMCVRSDSADSLVRQRPGLESSQFMQQGDSTQDSFLSLLSSPRVAAPGESAGHQQRAAQLSAGGQPGWKSASDSNLARSPSFGDASAMSTPRAAVASQVITGTAGASPDAGAMDAWLDLDLDLVKPEKALTPEDRITVEAPGSTPDMSQTNQSNFPSPHRDFSKAFSNLSILSSSKKHAPSPTNPIKDTTVFGTLSNLSVHSSSTPKDVKCLALKPNNKGQFTYSPNKSPSQQNCSFLTSTHFPH
ncbi:hypothetical protein EGW08_015323 [Elysia chlorotica]|uniref:Uncharacterized protein n=1 Tax=Elysia chlorotica TaxID=188477 RepID=A0A3S0ZKF5_ELYCH|nr:hypothetical protein EGW08_015323 [Elysia chlorotica]